MSNVFKSMSSNTRGFILFAWPAGVLLAALAVILMIEDYNTSRIGYQMLPTQKYSDGIIMFTVAALPQLAQIVLFFIFGRDTRKGWAILLAGAFFAVDLGTDAWFKSNGSWDLMPLAVVESLFIFTLGSEVLFSIAAGFVAETFADFIVAFALFLKSAMDAMATMSRALGLGSDDEPPTQPRSQMPGDRRPGQ